MFHLTGSRDKKFFFFFKFLDFFSYSILFFGNFRGTVPLLHLLAYLSPETSKVLSAVRPCHQSQQEETLITGRLLSKGDTTLLPSHFSGVQWWLFSFSVHKTQPTMPLTDDNVSSVAEPDQMNVPSREQLDHSYIPPPLPHPLGVDSLTLRALRLIRTA